MISKPLTSSITVIAFLFVLSISAFGQDSDSLYVDSLFQEYVLDYDSAGFLYFYPGKLEPGDLFSFYEQMYPNDTLNDWELIRHEQDSLYDMHHYHYQQTYRGLDVEAAEYTEHGSEEGYLVFSHGKIVDSLGKDVTNDTISKRSALQYVFDTIQQGDIIYHYAWEDTAWENELKAKFNDSTATYYPEGKLLWAINNYNDLGYLINPERYQLAWKFNIFCLKPFFQRTYYVDAYSGDILRITNLMPSNGPADIPNHGTRIIDTKWSIGSVAYRLRATDELRDIHTKYPAFKIEPTPKTPHSDVENRYGWLTNIPLFFQYV